MSISFCIYGYKVEERCGIHAQYITRTRSMDLNKIAYICKVRGVVEAWTDLGMFIGGSMPKMEIRFQLPRTL